MCLAVTLLSVSAAHGQVTQSLSVQATFAERVSLSFDRSMVTLSTEAFDPDSVVPITAAPLTVTVKARVADKTRLELSVTADGPLRNATAAIPLNNLSWTIEGQDFDRNRTTARDRAQRIGQFRGPGVWTGTQIYQFTDSWNHPVGSYTTVMTYTLSAP